MFQDTFRSGVHKLDNVCPCPDMECRIASLLLGKISGIQYLLRHSPTDSNIRVIVQPLYVYTISRIAHKTRWRMEIVVLSFVSF